MVSAILCYETKGSIICVENRRLFYPYFIRVGSWRCQFGRVHSSQPVQGRVKKRGHLSAWGCNGIPLRHLCTYLSIASLPLSLGYIFQIVMNAIMSAVLGSYVDNQWNKHQNIYPALRNIGPVQFSIIAGFIFIATLIPKGSFLLNPDLLDEEVPDVEFSDFTTTHSEGNSRVDAEGSIKSGFRQSLDFSETEHRRRSAEVNMFVAEEDDR